MDITASRISLEHPLVGVEEWLDISGNFSLLSCFIWLIVVSLWETNLGLQEAKLLFIFNCLLMLILMF
jgi:hypothetical protein